jgi:hypothetical protein
MEAVDDSAAGGSPAIEKKKGQPTGRPFSFKHCIQSDQSGPMMHSTGHVSTQSPQSVQSSASIT